MTDSAALTSRVAELIEEVLQVEVPDPGTDLVAAGLIDSLVLVSLITEVELEFAIQLPIDEFDLSRFRSAEQIAAVVAELAPDPHVA
ncbi:MAG TPA: phosphopantetheine-binding protein [Conexibacter sp.]|jgi:acyl carrier protein|nr:phosphopantetheine-binding protein [Conexibacter sp.]